MSWINIHDLLSSRGNGCCTLVPPTYANETIGSMNIQPRLKQRWRGGSWYYIRDIWENTLLYCYLLLIGQYWPQESRNTVGRCSRWSSEKKGGGCNKKHLLEGGTKQPTISVVGHLTQFVAFSFFSDCCRVPCCCPLSSAVQLNWSLLTSRIRRTWMRGIEEKFNQITHVMAYWDKLTFYAGHLYFYNLVCLYSLPRECPRVQLLRGRPTYGQLAR